jgi:membrane-bound metal-dependent hydrolase YbcI (DUF457 family)
MRAQGIVKRYHILYWFLNSPKMMPFWGKSTRAQGIVKRYHILYWFLNSPKMMPFWGKSMHILLSYAANGLLPRSNGKIAPWFI